MIKYISIVLLIFAANLANAKTIKIAVVDTGFNMNKSSQVKLCKNGHKDFTGTGIQDTHGHGTNVAGLIAKDNSKVDYCLYIIKFWSNGKGKNLLNLIDALIYVSTLKVDIIHLSLGGIAPSKLEKLVIVNFLNHGKTVVAAAGNESMNLNQNCNYYPACYDKRIKVIGNKRNRFNKANYGSFYVDYTIDGNNKTALGITLSGSSQSAAIYTGKYVKTLDTLNEK